MKWYRFPESWRFILLRYLPRLVLLSLAWEIVQLPLYTLWADPSPGRIAFAVVHCTGGDAMIGTLALIIALILCRSGQPARWSTTRIGWVMVILAVAYTVLSERLNLANGNWAYSAWMPVVPWLEVGLAPLVQWVVVPWLAWWWADRQVSQVYPLG